MTMWNDHFENILRGYLPFLDDREPLTEDLSLREFGLDSLGTVELLGSLENTFNVRFTDDALTAASFQTPATLWTVLNDISPSAA